MEESNKVIDIHPLTRGKRMLVFLGDFLICFILTFVLTGIACQPLMSLITGLDKREETAIEAEKNRDEILYEEKLLFYKNTDSKYVYESNLEFTFQRYLSYYLFDEEHPENVSSNAFGHQEESEVFKHYYIDICNDEKTYNSLFSDSKYFVKENNLNIIKADYSEQLKHFYYNGDELSENGKTYYNDMAGEFLNVYAGMIETIKKNDLVKDGRSFVEFQKKMDSFADFSDWMYVISTLIAFVLSWAILFILLPLIFRNGQTLTMKVMKVYRVGMNSLYVLSKGENILIAIYHLFLSMAGLFFIPLLYVPFYYLFNLPLLVSLSIVSLIFIIASFVILLVNKYRRAASDLLSRTVIITEEDLNKIYEVKGYQF